MISVAVSKENVRGLIDAIRSESDKEKNITINVLSVERREVIDQRIMNPARLLEFKRESTKEIMARVAKDTWQ